ncbi:MAG: hypothetical protein WBC91_25735 [Phototrophicaceae bacterium]
MNRLQMSLLLLTMPFWLGILMLLWLRNPLLILIPCGLIIMIGLVIAGLLIYAADLRTRDDWDLVIRSVLHRLGFSVAPPKSLMDDSDLELHHHAHSHDIKKDD